MKKIMFGLCATFMCIKSLCAMENPLDIHICFASDNNYAKPTCVAMTSILINSSAEESLHFHIIDTGIDEEIKNKFFEISKNIRNCDIEFLRIDDSIIEPFKKSFDKGNKRPGFPYTALCRLFIPYLFPNLDKVLYIDGDTIVSDSLKDLWNTDVSEYYFAGAKDWTCEFRNSKREYVRTKIGIQPERYINAGVLLMNTKSMRNDDYLSDVTKQMKNVLETCTCYDQDIVNLLWNDKILLIDGKYNCFAGSPNELPCIIHYAWGKKPWIKKDCLGYDIWSQYAKITELYPELKPFKPTYHSLTSKLIEDIIRIHNEKK